ncbi:MAG TPA: OsmC family protein [Rhodocyclaceae bacterium]|nr:OsmC family protein [Rhodocyclaceae bacterium]
MSRTVIVKENGHGRYQQDIIVGDRHRLVADEPVEVGGDDMGPAPFDFLLASLGACTSMTVRMYAQRKEWPLKQVQVAVRLDKREDESGHKVERIERVITLEGDLSDEQRQRLLEIANKCPTHRFLQQPARIDSRLAE